jgi:Tol biopolymer transport system component
MTNLQTGAATSFLAFLLSVPAHAQITQRVTFDMNGGPINGSCFSNAMSGDGRYVAFESDASDLVPGDTNGARDIFVRDRLLGTTQRVSVSTAGAQSNGDDFWAPFISLSADGRFVMFESNASNLVAGDTNGRVDIFVRDRQLGTTERISVDSAGIQANGDSKESSSSADGRYVAFRSYASNLVAGDTNGFSDVFVRDQVAGTTERVSVDSAGAQGNSTAQSPVISGDGRYVAFGGYADNLVPGDTNGLPDVFVHDRTTGTTVRINLAPGGGEADGSCWPSSFSSDGRFLAFEGFASNLVPGDNNTLSDVFVRDLQLGVTDRASVSTAGADANAGIMFAQYPAPVISADGRFVVFTSESTNLVSGDTNGVMDIFLRDRVLGTTERMSVDNEATQGDEFSFCPWISADGRYVSFSTAARNLDGNDTNQWADIYIRDRDAAAFVSLCHPGTDGVIGCQCSNPPLGPGRGCNNSSATGGATLSASGAAYLSMDTLRFTASDEKPTALSIVTQWTGFNPTGSVFGMGLRCTSGTFRRLYTRQATGGSFMVPNPGDPSVSARSAALGDVLQPGSSRWYLVYYRDPNVLGTCPFTSTYNATPTGRVTWSR